MAAGGGEPGARAVPLDAARGLHMAVLGGLLASDLLLVNGSLLFGFWMRLFSPWAPPTPPWISLGTDHLVVMALDSVVVVHLFRVAGLYRREVYSQVLHQAWLILRAVSLGMLLLLAVSYVSKRNVFMERRSILAVAWATLCLGEILLRCVAASHLLRHPRWRRRAVIVGAGERGQFLAEELASDLRSGFDVVGFLDDAVPEGTRIGGIPVLGGVASAGEAVARQGAREAFVTLEGLPRAEMLALIDRLRARGLGVRILGDFFDTITGKVQVETVRNLPLVPIRERRVGLLDRLAKRGLDLALAVPALVLASPLLALAAALIRLGSPGPVLYRQERLGRCGRPFRIYKLRTMYEGAPDEGYRRYMTEVVRGSAPPQPDGRGGLVHKPVGDARVTPVGRWLRRWSLDELPQLLNVLRGEMSLVGPRPPLAFEVEVYDAWHRRRLEVLPGITGLWQVSGRTRTGFEPMVLLDIYYIENWSLGMDLAILLRTLPAILSGVGGH
ncbi:MAG: sugar transferase [Planctomycetes bacterium]|nr:sugar transferase [Planctomycetota bacterium]